MIGEYGLLVWQVAELVLTHYPSEISPCECVRVSISKTTALRDSINFTLGPFQNSSPLFTLERLLCLDE